MNKCPKCGFSNPRNLDQNGLSHVWYLQIGDFMGTNAADAKAYCKLWFGVPILRGEAPEFRDRYDKLIKGRMTYEEKLEIMHWLPISSLMSKGQFARYMGDIQHHFAEQGLVLASINEPEMV